MQSFLNAGTNQGNEHSLVISQVLLSFPRQTLNSSSLCSSDEYLISDVYLISGVQHKKKVAPPM